MVGIGNSLLGLQKTSICFPKAAVTKPEQYDRTIANQSDRMRGPYPTTVSYFIRNHSHHKFLIMVTTAVLGNGKRTTSINGVTGRRDVAPYENAVNRDRKHSSYESSEIKRVSVETIKYTVFPTDLGVLLLLEGNNGFGLHE